MAMLVAFHVRRVKIKALKETKEIVVIIYINSLTLLLWIVAEFVLYSYHEAYPTVFGLALLSGASVFLTLVFVPKVCFLFVCLFVSWIALLFVCLFCFCFLDGCTVLGQEEHNLGKFVRRQALKPSNLHTDG